MKPGQELLSQKSSHEQTAAKPSHRLTADQWDRKSMERATSTNLHDYNPGSSPQPLPLPKSSTSNEFFGDLIEAQDEAFFVDGSSYEGTWDTLGIAGAGSYRMPHRVVYEGEIRDGFNHGNGTLKYPGNQVIDGVWIRGDLKNWRYTFADGFVFEDAKNWDYCRFPDRRFYVSKKKGLNPAGRSFKTQDQPTKVIPSGCYDSGDGIFDPSTLCVTNFDQPSKIIRIPTTRESEWITKYCRKGGTVATGYQPWLNENWSSNPPNTTYRLPFSQDSPESWWKRISTFERDTSVIVKERRRSLSYLENSDESTSQLDGISSNSDRRLWKSVCVSKESEIEICCSDKENSEELLTEDLDSLRRVVCEELDYGEYEGGEGEPEGQDLLMTVCCPPEDTYRIIRKKEKSIQALSSEEEIKIAKEKEEEEEEKEEEEFEDLEKSEESSSESEESLIDSNKDVNYGPEEEYYFEEEIWGEKSIEESEDYGSSSSSEETKKSTESEKSVIEKRKRIQRSKKKIVKKVPKPRKQKKQPCPEIIDADDLLQKKVGDLLFSPALEAPRSPVHLIRKKCDNKLCKKSKSSKQKSKCGDVQATIKNLKKKRTSVICDKNDKKLSRILKNDKNKICLGSKLFVTPQNE